MEILEVCPRVNSQSMFANRTCRGFQLSCLALVALPGLLEAQTTTTITATPAVLAFSYQLGTSKLPTALSVALKSNAPGLTVSLAIAGDLPGNAAWRPTP